MKFRGYKARSNGYEYEIQFSQWLDGKAVDPYYVDIHPVDSPRCISTEMTHRFLSKEAAEVFCQNIADGKITLEGLREEQEAAYIARERATDRKNRSEAETLLSHLDAMGVSFDTAMTVFRAVSALSPEVRTLCSSMSKDRSDPAAMVQENIVNISMKASEMILQKGVDLDHYDGFKGLTNSIICAAKRFEREIGSKTDFNAPDAPDYWEAIDKFAEKVLSEEYELVEDREEDPAIAQITFNPTGVTRQYTDANSFLSDFETLLLAHGPFGIKAEVLDKTNYDLRYEKDKLIYDEFGEEMPSKEDWLVKVKELDAQAHEKEQSADLDSMLKDASARKIEATTRSKAHDKERD